VAQALLEMKAESESTGSTCALLTPAIKAKLREMDSGQVLEVRVNDPTAREDVAAWCRLSGNELLAIVDEGQRELRFFLRKK
jgi:TusA-related sulfurtransferase